MTQSRQATTSGGVDRNVSGSGPWTWWSLIPLVIVALLSLLQTVHFFSVLIDKQYDDSYITYRYARNLGLGVGWVFNPGESVNSASSTLYTLMLAPIAWLGIDAIPLVGAMTGLVSFVLLLGYLVWQAARVAQSPARLAAAAVPVFVVGFSAVNQLWTLSGMETLPFLLCLTLALGLSTMSRIARRRVLFGLSLSLIGLSLIRPEGQGLALAIGLGATVRLWPASRVVTALVPMCVALGGAVVQGLWQWMTFGSLFGTPVEFKGISRYYVLSPIEGLQQVPGYFLAGLSPAETVLPSVALGALGLFCALLLVAIARSGGLGRLLDTLIPLLLGLGAFAVFVLVAARSDYFRYLTPLSVFVAVAILVGLRELKGTPTERGRSSSFLLGASGLGFILIYIPAQLVALQALAQDVGSRLYLQSARIEMGRWLEAETPPGTRILAGDLGALAYFNPSNTYVDSVGLTNAGLTEGLIAGRSYRELIRDAGPQWVVDTVGETGTIGSEATHDDPSQYYTLQPDPTDLGSFRRIWQPLLVKRLPSGPDVGQPFIGAYRLQPPG